MDDLIGTNVIKAAVRAIQEEAAKIEREQALLTMRITLLCSKVDSLANAINNWNSVLACSDPERRVISTEGRL